MSNPAIDFIDLADQFGTQISSYTVGFGGSFTSQFWVWGSEFLVVIVQMLLTYSIWLLDMIINQGLLLGVAGSVYQSLLDTIYRYVNPLILGTVGFMILMARIFIGDKVVSNEKTGRITGFELNYQGFGDEAWTKKISNQLMNTAVLMFIIIVAMANPFTLLTKIFGFINWAVASLSPTSTGSSPQIDGLLAPMLQLINYQDVLSPSCNEMWSRTLASGGSVAKLSCLDASQKAATTAGPVTLVLAGLGLVLVAGFGYFAFVIVSRFSWMLYTVVINVAVVPWQAAFLIAQPGSERQKLDSIKDKFLDAAKGVFWLLISVVAAVAVPAALLQGLAMAKMPAFVTMLLSSVLFAFAGRVANKRIGRKFKRAKDGTRVEIKDGTTGWNDFRHHGGFGQWFQDPFNQAQKASADELAMSDAIINGSSVSTTTSQSSMSAHSASSTIGQKGGTVNSPVPGDPEMDAAMATVDLRGNEPTLELDMFRKDGQEHVVLAERAADGTAVAATQSTSEFVAAAVAAVAADAKSRAAHSDDDVNGVPADMADTAAGIFDGVKGVNADAAGGSTDSVTEAGGRHHRVGEQSSSVAAAQAGAVSALNAQLDPETARRQSINSYLGAVEQISSDPDAVDDDQLSVTQPREAESTAFDRVAKVFSDSEVDDAANPGVKPDTPGVVGRSGEFLAAARDRAKWEECRTLGKTLGINVVRPDDGTTENSSSITFYSTTDDGINVIRYPGRDGFGDVI